MGTLGNDITITRGTDPPVTITGGGDLTDTDNNYAAKVAGLLSQAGTGDDVKASRLAVMPQSQRRPVRAASSTMPSTRPAMR